MYIQLKELFDQFTCEDVIKDSVHSANTQKNEALNNVIACLCPKNKHLCGSLTLLTRICIAVTYTNIGFEEFYKKSSNASEYPTSKMIYSQTFF